MHKSKKRLAVNKQVIRNLTEMANVSGGRLCSTISIVTGPTTNCPAPTGLCPPPTETCVSVTC